MKNILSVDEHYTRSLKHLKALRILLFASCVFVFIVWATEVYFNQGGGRLAEILFVALLAFIPPILFISALMHYVSAKRLEYLERHDNR